MGKVSAIIAKLKHIKSSLRCKGPSIYDVHTEGGGGQAQVDACGRGSGSSPMWTSTKKFKLESTDVILYSSHAKKLVFFNRISSLNRKKWTFFCDINYKISDINY